MWLYAQNSIWAGRCLAGLQLVEAHFTTLNRKIRKGKFAGCSPVSFRSMVCIRKACQSICDTFSISSLRFFQFHSSQKPTIQPIKLSRLQSRGRWKLESARKIFFIARGNMAPIALFLRPLSNAFPPPRSVCAERANTIKVVRSRRYLSFFPHTSYHTIHQKHHSKWVKRRLT